MLALRVPALAFILMIYIASIVLQFVSGGWSILLLYAFTILIAIFALLHWHSYRWVKKRVVLYFVIQGLITFTLANLMTGFFILVIIGILCIFNWTNYRNGRQKKDFSHSLSIAAAGHKFGVSPS